MITINQLSKHYKNKTVLSNVSTQFPTGQLSSLIGPNGAGKTTLLMSIARLLEAEFAAPLVAGDDGREPMICSEFVFRCYDEADDANHDPPKNLRHTVSLLVGQG